jgi:hypothetical protein
MTEELIYVYKETRAYFWKETNRFVIGFVLKCNGKRTNNSEPCEEVDKIEEEGS